jgi:multicomponent Na+:H+ antiporter subunit C
VIEARYEYWMTGALFLIGLYGAAFKRNLVKKLIGLNIMQSSTILFVVALGMKWNATIPIVPAQGPAAGEVYTAALPHVLMLTAIVVSVSTSGVAFALLILIHRRFGTLDERHLPGGRG